MDDRLDAREVVDRHVAQVASDGRHIGHAVVRAERAAAVQIGIQAHDLVTRAQEHGRQHGADVAQVAGHKDAHGTPQIDELADMERFRVALGRLRLETADAEQRQERLLAEPGAPALRREAAHEELRLATRGPVAEPHEDVRLAEVAFELRDLVAPDGGRPHDLPRELREQPVILMDIVERGRQDEVRGEAVDRRDELRLGGLEISREPGVAERADADIHPISRERPGRIVRLDRPLVVAAEHDPARVEAVRGLRRQPEQEAAGTDLEVVRVRPQREQPERPVGRVGELQGARHRGRGGLAGVIGRAPGSATRAPTAGRRPPTATRGSGRP